VGVSSVPKMRLCLLCFSSGDRCILYSSVSGDPVDSHLGYYNPLSGTPRAEDAKFFLGPKSPFGGRWVPKFSRMESSKSHSHLWVYHQRAQDLGVRIRLSVLPYLMNINSAVGVASSTMCDGVSP